ncbi:hypothetical protein AG1IA_02090 [Rhizoctonia solani AG-1 IA]|uniref:Uncharacterized protein n=1 Tax=Thanatephorus cucumeris (strain AG1-IA) TaxID=983506 RepID=L8X102_THACA|nr:hypothetical protein AG1IA_02090 [Rhizoctonia solani AG-1 IA]
MIPAATVNCGGSDRSNSSKTQLDTSPARLGKVGEAVFIKRRLNLWHHYIPLLFATTTDMATPPRSPQSPVNSPSMQTTPTSPTFLLPESTEDVHEKLRSLHCDELCTDSFEWTLIFAIMTTTLLVPMLFFCITVAPFGFNILTDWEAVTTPMYEAWWNGDKRALAASRAALCKSVESRNSRFGPGNNNRNFDLDIARIFRVVAFFSMIIMMGFPLIIGSGRHI